MTEYTILEKHLENIINKIFENHDYNTIEEYEKRKIIFEYLCNTLSYDYEMLEKIKEFELYKTKVKRDPIQELYTVVNTNKGICNAISQYYKLLLEKVGIKSYCLICDDGTIVKHQLNLVYDNDNDSFSFDDITTVIVNRGTIDDLFDYDLEYAKSINQGNKILFNNQNYLILPEEYINYLIKRDKSISETLKELPDNIISIKNKTKKRNY